MDMLIIHWSHIHKFLYSLVMPKSVLAVLHSHSQTRARAAKRLSPKVHVSTWDQPRWCSVLVLQLSNFKYAFFAFCFVVLFSHFSAFCRLTISLVKRPACVVLKCPAVLWAGEAVMCLTEKTRVLGRVGRAGGTGPVGREFVIY